MDPSVSVMLADLKMAEKCPVPNVPNVVRRTETLPLYQMYHICVYLYVDMYKIV